MSYKLKQLEAEFTTITSRFDLEDWRTVRNEDYWKSDGIKDQLKRLTYKMIRIRYYDKHGVPIKPIKMIEFNDFKCEVIIQKYGTGNLAVRLVDIEDGLPIVTATVNVDGLDSDEIAIKDYSENEGVYDALLNAGIITPKHRELSTGFVTVPVCKLKEDYTI